MFNIFNGLFTFFFHTGTLCEFDVDVCSDSTLNICQNGATCSDGEGPAFTCRCAPGYTGFYCETEIDECLSNPCQNQATCTDLVADFNCTCSEGILVFYAKLFKSCELDYFDSVSNGEILSFYHRVLSYIKY